jgi:alpha-tubulin suppressor-like RCC1 family protein
MADIDFITPRRIACGFMHTAMLSTTAKSEDDAESSHDSTSLFMWGCNRYNMIGANCGHKDDDEMETMLKLPQNITSRISKEKGLEDFSRKYIYEVACGGFHTVLLDKRPDADGGLIWVMGLANNGRLGVGMENPAEVEAQWYAVPRQVGFPDGARVARIACGADHTLAIGENGAVFAWGLGNYGNLGTGSTEDCWTPAPVAVLDGTSQPVVGIAAGAKHSLAVTQYFPDLMSGGNLFAWGFGGSGRLGLGNTRASLKPSMIEHPGTFVDLCCGEASSGAIDLHGAVYTWGCGSFGRLGHGEETDTPLPREVESLGGTPCMQLAMGMTHAVVVTRKGRLFAWGQGAGLGLLDENDHSVVPTPREVLQPDLDKTLVTQVACGTYHSLVVTKDGELFSWGTGTEGRLGISGSAFKTEAFPKPLAITGGAKGWVGDPAEDNANHKKKRERGGGKEDDTNTVIAVSAGGSHTALLFGTAATTAAGGCDMWMWGGGDHGQTGLGKLVDELEPKCAIPSASMSSVKVTMVACGVYHTLIVSSTSSLYSFGSGEFGQLGNGNTGSITIPELVNLRGVVSIAAGEDHSAAVLQSGELFTWGSADSGKLGVGAAMTSGIIGLPRQVPKLTEQIKDVDCGQSHTAAVASDGSLYTFGAGWFGRLGHNSTANKYSAAKVLPFGEDEPFPVTIVACGSYHTCAVHEGYLYICGRDRSVCQPDHLKAFTKMAFDRDPKEPAPIITAIACGDQHSMVIAQDLFNKEDPKAISYSLWCWGDNKKGQIAGKTQRVEFPEKIRGIPHGFVPRLLSTGTAHSILAGELRNGKTKVYVWGHGGCGRLGVELSMEDDKPVRLQYNQPTELVCPWEEEEKKTSAQPEEPEPAIETTVAEDAPAEETSVKEGGAKERMSLFARIVQHLVEEEEETPQCMEDNLQKEHLKLSQEFEEVMRKIRAIWKLEEEQNRQEDLLEGSIVQNMKLMHPKNDLDLSKSKILPEVSSVLHLVEKLFFYLQQQPIYLTSLCVPDAKKVEGLGDGGLGVRDELTAEECELVVKVVTAIFADMHFPRVKHLYQSLLKEIGQAEFEKAKRIEEILERVQLDKPKSPLVPLLQYMSKANEYKIGDTSTGGKGERGMGQAMLDLSSKDQPSILASLLAEKVGEGKNESDLVIYLDETEHKDFSTGDVTAIRIEVQRHTDRLSHWVEKHFLPMVVALPFHEDFKSYFVQIKEKLEDKFRNDPAGDRIFDIMTSIFIVGILEPIFADALTYAPRKWGLHKMNPDQYEMLGKFGTFIGLVGRVNLLSTFAPNLTNVGRGLRQKLQYAIFNDPSRNLDGIMFKNAMTRLRST